MVANYLMGIGIPRSRIGFISGTCEVGAAFPQTRTHQFGREFSIESNVDLDHQFGMLWRATCRVDENPSIAHLPSRGQHLWQERFPEQGAEVLCGPPDNSLHR
jgi:hypothetical protein